MSKFILVKNADDSGDTLLRIEYILAAQDYKEHGTFVDYGDCIKHATRIKIGATASEVLAAIQEAQGVVPRHVEGVLAVDMSKGQDASRFYFARNADTSQANGEKATRNTILAGPIAERWHHISPLRASYIDGSQLSSSAFNGERVSLKAQIMYAKNALARALLNLTGNAWEVSEHIFPDDRISFVCKNSLVPHRGFPVRFLNEESIDEWATENAQDAVNHVFSGEDNILINSVLEEWGTSVVRGEPQEDGWTPLYAVSEAGEVQEPICQCAQYQGDNPVCPAHGKGTPWELLHGD